ncbi:hypothetical protein AOQ84DRAFT_387134 [Glonium stellatum]|uniref:Uncharacterized protein n=1 Tax=Glonium stellatum TaxID=574774 RepID=A0A8E2JVH9_9PEZI|nr:hypothetical protein AOQ84DRAFT_387134 [Glonium stellatum]
MSTTPLSLTVSDEAGFNETPYSRFPYSNGSDAALKPYIALRSPASSNYSQSIPTELSTTAPQAHISGHKWHLAHSSRTLWTSRRNVELLIKSGQQSMSGSGSARSELWWSWQELESDEVKKLTKYPEEDTADDWEVLGEGKEGGLERWMIETEYGIEDGSGEARADWRSRWLVLYFPTTPISPVGIDIFSNRVRQDPSSGRKYVVYDETIRQIRDELLKMGNSDLGKLTEKINEVRNDGNRKEEVSNPSVSADRIWRNEDEPQETSRGFRGTCTSQ